METLENIRLNAEARSLVIIDQTLLPGELKYLELTSREELFEAISALRVRGAPAIGIAAAYGYYLCAESEAESPDFFRDMDDVERYLASARPTAVNLGWALARMRGCLKRNALLPRAELLVKLRAEAISIHEEDKANNLKISEYGLSLLNEGDGVLTHCNAGALATSHYGTALGPMLLAAERGIELHVFADETRPLLQGSRLTAFELMRAGADVTLVCDNMASYLMKSGRINAVFTGCDRVCRNGDAANKIGTSGLAILARHYGIPFYMFAPLSTVDLDTPNGAGVKIEQRPPEEVTELYFEKRMAPVGVKVLNPAFDVVDHELITGIVTEAGVITAPFEENLEKAKGK